MMTVRILFCLLSFLVGVVGCSGADDGAAGAEGVTVAPTASAVEATGTEPINLTCVAGELYAGLAEYVSGFQTIVRSRPQQDTYVTDDENRRRMAAWETASRLSADSLVAAAEPVVVRDEVRGFRYDPEAQMLIIEDFGAYAVPGVVVDPGQPYPSITCLTGPFFTCQSHGSEDSWLTQVVQHQTPFATGSDARLPLSSVAASAAGLPGAPLEFEAEFALVAATGSQHSLLPVVALRSLRFLAGGNVVAAWEGEATPAGRTTVLRMLAFQPEPVTPCT